MSSSVELSPQTFARLQAHAVPLVDSIESVINRIVDYYEAKGGKPVPASGGDDSENVRQFTPATPPSLKHTKVLTVEFCGKTLEHSQVKWNGLLVAAVREAMARAKSPSAFKRLVIVNFVDGQKTDEDIASFPKSASRFKGKMQTRHGVRRAILLSSLVASSK